MRVMLENLERREYLTALPVCVPGPVIIAPAYDGHFAVVDGVLNVWAADPADFGATWSVQDVDPVTALFGADGEPDFLPVRQGPTPDCYVLAAVAGRREMKSLIWWDGFGWAEQWQRYFGPAVIVHTANTFSVALQQPTGEVYWEVAEKTYAWLRTWNGETGQLAASVNTLASTGYGWTSVVWSQMGLQGSLFYAQSFMPAEEVAAKITAAEASGSPVVLATNAGAGSGLVSNHAYVVTGIYADGAGGWSVQTYNPWGFYEIRSLNDLMLSGTIEIMGEDLS